MQHSVDTEVSLSVNQPTSQISPTRLIRRAIGINLVMGARRANLGSNSSQQKVDLDLVLG